MDDLPQRFVIRESSHRIHNPFTSEKLATLGRALYLSPGTSVLDLACGSGEMLCTWARDHRLTGTGVDVSTAFIGAARARAIELGVADRVTFIHGDAAGYVTERPVGVAACIGATWIGDGVAGTVELLRRSLSPGGIMLVGEPYWRREPPDQATLEGCHGIGMQDWLPLPELIESFGLLGCDVVEMVLSAIPEVLRVTLCETGGRRPLTAASPGAGSKLPATSTRRRGGDQYAPGQRVRQRSGKR